MNGWQPIETAPKDGTHILLKTGDFGVVEGWWNPGIQNFYEPETMGDWWSDWQIGTANGNDQRLVCGAIPLQWRQIP